MDVYVIREDGKPDSGASLRPHPRTGSPGGHAMAGGFISLPTGPEGVKSGAWASTAASHGRLRTAAGIEPMESPDGQFLYHLANSTNAGSGLSKLMRTPTEGGDTEFVFDGLRQRLWQVTEKGILFIRLAGRRLKVNLLRFDDRSVTEHGKIAVSARRLGGEFARIAASSRWPMAPNEYARDGMIAILCLSIIFGDWMVCRESLAPRSHLPCVATHSLLDGEQRRSAHGGPNTQALARFADFFEVECSLAPKAGKEHLELGEKSLESLLRIGGQQTVVENHLAFAGVKFQLVPKLGLVLEAPASCQRGIVREPELILHRTWFRHFAIVEQPEAIACVVQAVVGFMRDQHHARTRGHMPVVGDIDEQFISD